MKNYLVLISVLLITIVLIGYSLIWYNVHKEYNNNISYIDDYIDEINKDEFENYIRENPDVFVYFCIKGNEKCNLFEKDLVEILKNSNYSDDLVYLNLKDQEVKNLYDKYRNGTIPYTYPLIVHFFGHKIDDYVDSIELVEEFFERNLD
jgi:hypothetical protein